MIQCANLVTGFGHPLANQSALSETQMLQRGEGKRTVANNKAVCPLLMAERCVRFSFFC